MSIGNMLESLINEVVESLAPHIGTVKLLTLPSKDNDFLLKDNSNNIQGIFHKLSEPSTLYTFVINVDSDGCAESLVVLPYGESNGEKHSRLLG